MSTTLSLGLLSFFGSSVASAQVPTVVLMVEDPAVIDALGIEAQSRGLDVLVSPPPIGDTPLLRAASAQETVRRAHADMALWLDPEGAVRAVHGDGERIRHAPLSTTADPATTAAVGASLLDELVGPHRLEDLRTEVEVSVAVTISATPVSRDVAAELTEPPKANSTTHAPEAPIPPVVAPGPDSMPVEPMGADEEGYAQEGFVLRGGVVFAGIAAGAEVELGYFLTEHLRVSVLGDFVGVFAGNLAVTTGLSLSYVAGGANGRFELGAQGRMIVAIDPDPGCTSPVGTCLEHNGTTTGWQAGGHAGWMWELGESVGLGFGLSAGVARMDGEFLPQGLLHGILELPL